MNQLALSELHTRLKPVIGDTKLKAVTETSYLCRRLSSVASQVENQIREPSELPLAGFWNVAPRWHSTPRSDYTQGGKVLIHCIQMLERAIFPTQFFKEYLHLKYKARLQTEKLRRVTTSTGFNAGRAEKWG